MTSIDYFLKHASGAYRTHLHDGSSDDGAQLDWDSCWSDAVHSHASDAEGGLITLTTGVTGILPILNGGTGSATQNFVDLTTAQNIAGVKTFASQIVLPSPLQTSQGGTGSTANANTAGGVVVPAGAVNSANGAVVLDSNSKISVAQLGAWTSVSIGTSYLAATDGFVIGSLRSRQPGGGEAYVYTDASNPPTTARVSAFQWDGLSMMPFLVSVRKGDYYKVTSGSESGYVPYAYWIPLGS